MVPRRAASDRGWDMCVDKASSSRSKKIRGLVLPRKWFIFVSKGFGDQFYNRFSRLERQVAPK